MAHSVLVRGERPEFHRMTMNDEDKTYYRKKAQRYRAAEAWRAENPDRFTGGKKSGFWKKPRANQCISGDAIREHMNLEPVRDETKETG